MITHDTTRAFAFLLFVRAESFASVVDFLTQFRHLRTKGIGSEVPFVDHAGIEA